MKRLLFAILILASVALAQDETAFADALRRAPADAKLVLISGAGQIVGYSEDLSRPDLRIVLAEDFRGRASLLITASDGSVVHEFSAVVDGGGAVSVDGRSLGESLAVAGYGPPTFVTTGPPGDVPAGPGAAPGRARGAPDLPPQAGGPPPGENGQGPNGAGGDDDGEDGDDTEDEEDGRADEGDSGGGGGPPGSAGPP